MSNLVLKTLYEFIRNIYPNNIFSAPLPMQYYTHYSNVATLAENWTNTSQNVGIMSVFFILLITNFISSYIVFSLGYISGAKVLKSRYISKYFSQEKYNRAKSFVDKYGIYSIIISKFVPGTYNLVVLMTGIFKYSKAKCYLSVVLVTIVHSIVLIYVGVLLGKNAKTIGRIINRYDWFTFVTIAAILAVYLIYKMILAKTNLRRGKNE